MKKIMVLLAEWKMASTDRSFSISTSHSPTTIVVKLMKSSGASATHSWLLYPEDADNERELNVVVQAVEAIGSVDRPANRKI